MEDEDVFEKLTTCFLDLFHSIDDINEDTLKEGFYVASNIKGRIIYLKFKQEIDKKDMKQETEKDIIYIIVRNGSFHLILDKENWGVHNSDFREKTVFRTYKVYQCEINGKIDELYYEQNKDEWIKEK